MKVGVVLAHVSWRAAGVWSSVGRLAKALSQSGVRVEVFGLADSESRTDRRRWDGPPLKVHRVLGSRSFGYAPRLGTALHAGRLSLLHANGLWMYPSLASSRWGRRGGRPYIVSPHGMLDPWALKNASWKKRLAGRWFEDAHLARAACLHALTEAEARAVRGYGLRNPVCVIPNGIDLAYSEQRYARPGWVTERDRGRRILLFLGRLHPKKGLANLLRAWAAAHRNQDRRDEWVLAIAGWDQAGHEAELSELARNLGIDDKVRFVGPQFDGTKAASYAAADAFVLPSVSEGLPLTVLEAWSHGLPVLMTDSCNLPEGFAAGAALPIEPQPGGIEEGIGRLWAMPDAARRNMGRRGRALVAERFAWPRIAEEMGAVYEWVLGAGAPPASVMTD
jgi:glycosyltransferase involved in cell wall biosynthesis